MMRTTARLTSPGLRPMLALAAAAAMTLGLAGCNQPATTPNGMATAATLTGHSPSAAGGASGAGTQNGPSGGIDNGASAQTSPAP